MRFFVVFFFFTSVSHKTAIYSKTKDLDCLIVGTVCVHICYGEILCLGDESNKTKIPACHLQTYQKQRGIDV